MPDNAIYAQLTMHAGLTALIAGRVYASEAPQDPTYPCVVYSRISDVPTIATNGTIEWRDMRYQVSCYATTRPSALAISEQVIAALHNVDFSPSAVLYTRFENLVEILEPDSGPGGIPLYHIAVDFILMV